METQRAQQQLTHERLLAEARMTCQQQLDGLCAVHEQSRVEAQVQHDKEVQQLTDARKVALAEAEAADDVKVRLTHIHFACML